MALLSTTDRYYRNGASGGIYDLSKGGAGFTSWEQFTADRQTTGGTVFSYGDDSLLSAAVAEYASLHAATPATVNAISTAQAREAVRQRYIHYLQREPTEPPKVNVASDPSGWDFWTNALINDANAHGLDAALADLNMAFVASEEYKKLQAAASTTASDGTTTTGGTTTGTTTGSGTTGTTAAAGDESIITKGVNFVKEHYIIAGLIAVVGGMSLFGGDGRR